MSCGRSRKALRQVKQATYLDMKRARDRETDQQVQDTSPRSRNCTQDGAEPCPEECNANNFQEPELEQWRFTIRKALEHERV